MPDTRNIQGFVLCFMLTAITSQEFDNCVCGLGQKFNPGGDPVCLPCMNGEYSNEECHRNTECKRCSTAYRYNHEWLYRNCTKISNSVIKCDKDYYCDIPHRGIPGDCTLCMNCSSVGMFEAKSCDETSDTVCCPSPNMDAVLGEDGYYTCQMTCKAGQYWSTVLDMCLNCPEHTFMPESRHLKTSCFNCFNLHDDPDPNMIVTLKCNSTHNAQVTCRTGSYLRTDGYLPACPLCKVCEFEVNDKFEARPCDEVTDTVCCPDKTMTAVRTDIGFSCKPPAVQTLESDDETNTTTDDKTHRFIETTKQVNSVPVTRDGSTVVVISSYQLLLCLASIFVTM